MPVWPDDFPREPVPPVTNKIICDLWEEIARDRRSKGDKEGSKRAFKNAKILRLPKRARMLLQYGRRVYR